MSETQDQGGRFEVRVTADSHFAWIRTRMALDRTLMAWVRTAVSLIGFGFTIVQFFQRFHEMEGVAPAVRPQAPRNLGLALMGAGVVALVIAALEYRRMVHYLWSDPYRPIAGVDDKLMTPIIAQTPILAVVIGIIVIGLFAFFAVVLRMV